MPFSGFDDANYPAVGSTQNGGKATRLVGVIFRLTSE